MKYFTTKDGFFSGNVGIGTTSPDDKLEIVDSSNHLNLKVADTISQSVLKFSDSAGLGAAINYDHNTDKLHLITDGTATPSNGALNIDSAGNVGIGTVIPSAKLQVNTFTDVTSTTVACINGQNTISLSENLTSKLSAGDTIRFNNPNTGDISKKQYEVDSITSNLLTLTQNLSFSASLYISKSQSTLNVESGNVGIGTTNPSANLEIEKDSYGDLSAGQGHMVLDTIGVAREEGKGPFINFRVPTSSSTSEDMANIGAVCSDSTSSSRKADLVFWTRDNTFSEKMRINASGNVGIGTTSPDETLHVSSAAGPLVAILEHTDGGSAELSFRDTNQTDQVKIGTVDGGFRIYTSNEEKIRIDADGNVGIGTASPDFNLSVVSNTDPAKIGIHGYGSFSDGTVAAQLLFLGKDSNDNNRTLAHIQVREHSHPSGTGSMEFFTRIGGNEVARMTISEAGNVGIGTTNPDFKLTVDNGIGNYGLKVIAGNNGDSNESVIEAWNWKTNGSDPDLLFKVRGDGNVGIGTASPESELHIKGDITFSGETTQNQGTRAEIVHTSGVDANGDNLSNDGGLLFRSYDNGTAVDALAITHKGKVGIGTNSPNYQLELSTDSAGKLSTNTWTVSSDSRAKENIELADLDVCYDNIKNIPLKRYTWSSEFYSEEQVKDRSKIGWIAQDVESVFPKAVDTRQIKYAQKYKEQVIPAVEEVLDEEGNVIQEAQEERTEKVLVEEKTIEDFKSLNADQLYASMYGAIQKLMQKVETLEAEVVTLKGTTETPR